MLYIKFYLILINLNSPVKLEATTLESVNLTMPLPPRPPIALRGKFSRHSTTYVALPMCPVSCCAAGPLLSVFQPTGLLEAS